MLLGQRRGDERARTDSGFEITFGEQLCIGVEDGKTGDAQLGCELAAGENLFARPQVAAQDGRAIAVIDLLVERRGVVAVDSE